MPMKTKHMATGLPDFKGIVEKVKLQRSSYIHMATRALERLNQRILSLEERMQPPPSLTIRNFSDMQKYKAGGPPGSDKGMGSDESGNDSEKQYMFTKGKFSVDLSRRPPLNMKNFGHGLLGSDKGMGDKGMGDDEIWNDSEEQYEITMGNFNVDSHRAPILNMENSNFGVDVRVCGAGGLLGSDKGMGGDESGNDSEEQYELPMGNSSVDSSRPPILNIASILGGVGGGYGCFRMDMEKIFKPDESGNGREGDGRRGYASPLNLAVSGGHTSAYGSRLQAAPHGAEVDLVRLLERIREQYQPGPLLDMVKKVNSGRSGNVSKWCLSPPLYTGCLPVNELIKVVNSLLSFLKVPKED